MVTVKFFLQTFPVCLFPSKPVNFYLFFSVVILLFCSQESHIPLGRKFGKEFEVWFREIWRDLIFFVAKDFVPPWAVKEN